MLDDMDLDIPEASSPPPAPRSGNRSFLLVAGILGAIMLLALIAMAYYALVILPAQRAAAPSESQLTQTALARATRTPTGSPTFTTTPSSTRTETSPPPSATSSLTETPVTPIFSNTPFETPGPATATVNALLTQAALAQTQAATAAATSTPTLGAGTAAAPTNTPTTTPSALPSSGFAEDIGAPGLLAMAAILLVIIILSRRLRAA